MIKPLFDEFRQSMLKNPTGSRKEAQDSFIAKMKSDPSYLEQLATDYFDRMAAVWTVGGENNDYTFQRTEASKGRGERISAAHTGKAKPYRLVSRNTAVVLETTPKQRAEIRKRNQKAIDDMKSKIRDVVLLDLELPNGKVLRHATGAECKKAGGFYSEIAKHVKPTQVVDRHLSEGDLQNIQTRFFRANAA